MRLVRLFRLAQEKRRKAREEQEMLELVEFGVIDLEDVEKQKALNDTRKSKLGSELSEAITQKVIVMILVMIIILPLVTYNTTDNSSDFVMNALQTFNMDQSVSLASKQLVLATMVNQTNSHTIPYHYLLQLKVTPSLTPSPPKEYNYDSYRLDEISDGLLQEFNKTDVDASTNTVYETSGVFTFRNLVILDATYSIILTIFVGFMLVAGAAVFTADADQLVLKPIERMMNLVEAVAANPLASFTDKDNAPGVDARGRKVKKEGDYETRLLESTIEKVTGQLVCHTMCHILLSNCNPIGLLRVGFGEAGAGIISANLSTDNKSAVINPLLPGVRVYAIFGFCDIHHFEDSESLSLYC